MPRAVKSFGLSLALSSFTSTAPVRDGDGESTLSVIESARELELLKGSKGVASVSEFLSVAVESRRESSFAAASAFSSSPPSFSVLVRSIMSFSSFLSVPARAGGDGVGVRLARANALAGSLRRESVEGRLVDAVISLSAVGAGVDVVKRSVMSLREGGLTPRRDVVLESALCEAR